MIISSCPLRISLFGGSTDNPAFLKKHGRGSVISFTSSIKTYTTIFQDRLGYNQNQQKFIINYTNREEVSNYDYVKNELVKAFLKHFNLNPITISMHSDVYSQGSGLASSSSYLNNLINCYSIFKDIPITSSEICKLSLEIERKFNPFCGLQDPYGCGIGGFKRMDFDSKENVSIAYLPTEFFKLHNMFLIFTGITRNSKNILQDISINVDKISPLLDIVEKAYNAIQDKNYDTFLNLISESWTHKKTISSEILNNENVKFIDDYLSNNSRVLAHRLCGAGAGGFFLAFSHDTELDIPFKYIKINLNTNGMEGRVI
jgi:D-glycero-alpha-D-manno-heptose-7-phosphate kinase